MSNAPAKNNRSLLYLLLGALVLKFAWGVLVDLYHTFGYLGLNTVLALDLSAYGQLTGGNWPSFALLGLGLGAAGGAIAAQRRYALARSVAIAGWVAIGLLFLLVYATVDSDTTFETETSLSPMPTQVVATTKIARSPPIVRSKPAAVSVPPSADTSSTAAAGWQQVTEPKLSLQANWTDSLASPIIYLPEGDKVLLRRQTANWASVTSTVTGMAGWVRRAGLRPIEPEAEPPIDTEPPPPPVARAVQPAKQASAANTASTIAAPTDAVPHPTGHQQHAGQIGDLAVTYILDWQASGELSGSYFYNQHPSKTFRLTGATLPNGELHLLEFTKGRQSARGVLQPQGSGYTGQLLAPDGQQLPITLE